MSSFGEDEFTEVTRDRKKRKALSSPTLPSQRKPGSSEPPLSSPSQSIIQVEEQDSSDHQWCRRKIQKLEATLWRTETVPP